MSAITNDNTPGPWAIGRHTPGYSPENAPVIYGSREEARRALESDMREWADDVADGCTADHDPLEECNAECATPADVGALLADDGPQTIPGAWSASVDYGRSLPMVWTLEPVDGSQVIARAGGADWREDGSVLLVCVPCVTRHVSSGLSTEGLVVDVTVADACEHGVECDVCGTDLPNGN